MCIAIIKPKGKDIPSKEYIENSFDNNPDGGGYAVKRNGYIKYAKGYFDVDEYYKVLQENIRKEDEALIHMRITTHGGTSKECCHPFPITNSYKKMRKTEGKTDRILIHNGVLGGKFGDEAKEGVSDTMVLTKYIDEARFSNYGKGFKSIMNTVVSGSNKVAILTNKGITMIGSGWTNASDGNWYSNSTYSYGCNMGYYNRGFNNWGFNDSYLYGGKNKKKKKNKSNDTYLRNHYTTTNVQELSTQAQIDLADDTCPYCLAFLGERKSKQSIITCHCCCTHFTDIV
tara:strand:+ start:3363 stop:4220 length:858 start_codon:yes stop_codon:yes gene_type:complete